LKEASRYVTVALDGQGADEQLGGYHNFFGSYFRELLADFRWFRLFSELAAYLKHHRSSTALQYLAFYLLPGHLKDYAGSRKIGWVDRDFYEGFRNHSNLGDILFNPKSLMESLLQHFEYKLEHNLKWNDLNSMYFSVELRVPFMDYRIVEKTLSLPPERIINHGYTKWILREAMEGTLPEQIRLRQDKVGFDNPSDEWFKSTRMMTLIHDTLNSGILKESGYVDLETCKNRYDLHLQGKISINKEIWQWLNLYHFLSKFR
jgi:asparagine synthase (glutamine-hydrolysing)